MEALWEQEEKVSSSSKLYVVVFIWICLIDISVKIKSLIKIKSWIFQSIPHPTPTVFRLIPSSSQPTRYHVFLTTDQEQWMTFWKTFIHPLIHSLTGSHNNNVQPHQAEIISNIFESLWICHETINFNRHCRPTPQCWRQLTDRQWITYKSTRNQNACFKSFIGRMKSLKSMCCIKNPKYPSHNRAVVIKQCIQSYIILSSATKQLLLLLSLLIMFTLSPSYYFRYHFSSW